MTMPDERMTTRRAIEALRAGVPNRDAVRVMGSSQPKLEERFAEQLQSCRKAAERGEQGPGMLIAGGFGTGKSHLLERFQDMALGQRFMCSKIVISKETPFHNPAKVYRAAVESARLPDTRGSAVRELASALEHRVNSPEYAAFFKWLGSPESGLSDQFVATVQLYECAKGDDEIRDSIIAFWAGQPLGIRELRAALRKAELAAVYKADRVPMKELALQRYRFMPGLLLAAGYAGWVLLVDEVELIGSYGIRSRALSYAELPRFMGTAKGNATPGLTSVLTITDDFASVVLVDRDDESKIPYKYNGERDLISQAELGMQIIKEGTKLESLDAQLIREVFEKLRRVYAKAYNWDPPSDYTAPDMTNSMRKNVKRWITQWDLARLYPGCTPSIVISNLKPTYEEKPDLDVREDKVNQNGHTRQE